jgi:hypothetical protein
MTWEVFSAVILGAATVTVECAAQSPPRSAPPPAAHAESSESFAPAPLAVMPDVRLSGDRATFGVVGVF